MSKAEQAWEALNERQRVYMEALFREDQGLEEEHYYLGATGRYSRAPARVWRRIYLDGQYAPTPRYLRSLGLWAGSGSTLGALADRGLIELGTAMPTGRPFVLMTRAGRAARRAGLRQAAS